MSKLQRMIFSFILYGFVLTKSSLEKNTGRCSFQCEVRSLGQQIILGNGYDIRRAKAIVGYSPWTDENVKDYTQIRSNDDKHVELIQETSFSDRQKRLGIEADMSVNVMSGMVKVGAGGKYLTTEKKSSTTLRFVIDFNSIDYFKSIPLDIPVYNKDFCKIETDSPTHVITSIQYGLKAFLLLEREVSSEENEHEVAVWMNAAIKGVTKKVAVKTNIDGKVSDKFDKSSISLKFVGNSNDVDTPTKLEDIDEFIEQLDRSARDNPQPVSFKITSIKKICPGATTLFSSIKDSILTDLTDILRNLADTELRVKSLADKKFSKNHAIIKESLDSYGRKLKEFTENIKQNIKNALISTRSASVENDAALKEIKTNFLHSSNFSPAQSDKFLSYLENQISRFDAYYNIQNLYVDEDHAKCTHPIKKDIYTFTFNCLPKYNLATQFFEGTLDTSREWIPITGSLKFSTFNNKKQISNLKKTCFLLNFKAFNPEHPVTFKVESFDGEIKKETYEFISMPEKIIKTSELKNAKWIGAHNYGDVVKCEDNSFAIGACAGGYRRDCRHHNTDYVHSLYCSEPNDKYTIKKTTTCESFNSRHGDKVTCPQQYGSVAESCSSGGKFDCKKRTGDGKISNVIRCCPSKLINGEDWLLKIGNCDDWQYGNHGELLVCREDYLITGRCGSGRTNNCRINNGQKKSHGIQCCQMKIE